MQLHGRQRRGYVHGGLLTDMRLCEIPNCDNKHHGRGLCMKHYRRLLRNNSPEKQEKGNLNLEVPNLGEPATLREISEELGISEGAIARIQRDALRKLRVALLKRGMGFSDLTSEKERGYGLNGNTGDI